MKMFNINNRRYIGSKARMLNFIDEVIKKALGGVLFIDEAYSLYMEANDEQDYGLIVIDCLVKAMEEHRDNLIVIMAGYTDFMEDLINSNPGLKSRISNHLYFESYKPDELLQLFETFCKNNMYVLEKDAKDYLTEKLKKPYYKVRFVNGNAREVRNMFEKVLEIQSQRLIATTNADKKKFLTITLDDLKVYFKEPVSKKENKPKEEVCKVIDFSAYKKQHQCKV